jgi:hypothetical protein
MNLTIPLHCATAGAPIKYQVLFREGLIKEERVYADSCIFDLDNRGGLGGNGFDAQKNGSTFFRFGADRDELKKALSIELCPVQPLRDMEYKKMEMIVARSQELLAPVSWREEDSTLACGHFAQFAKAVGHGCKAVFPNLADRFGRLNKAHLSSVDDEFKDIIEKGWTQKKMKFSVRAACPWIPSLAQRACNASNLVVSHGTEIETIVSILGTINGANDEASLENFASAAKSIADSSICSDYIEACATIARLYAGGRLGANLTKIDSFAKTLGASARWGESFTNAIANTKDSSLHQPTCKLRIAACAAQLTASDVKDGVYQFLQEKHVSKLLHHSSHQEMELALEHASDVCSQLEAADIDAGRINDVECAFMVRTVLFHLECWTESCTKTDFKDFDDIKRAFAAGVEALIVSTKSEQKGTKRLKNPCDWELAEPKTAQKENTTAPQESALVDDPTSPAYILKAMKIKDGGYVKEKTSGKVFKVTSITTDGTLTVQSFNLFETVSKYSVTLEQAVTDWAEAPTVTEQKQIDSDMINSSLRPPSLTGFYSSSCVWHILWDNAEAKFDERLAFYINPFEMRVAVDIPKGELMLLPFTTVGEIKCVGDVKPDKLPTFHAKCVSEHGTHVLFPPKFNKDKNEGLLIPFYHVTETTKEGVANMVWDVWEDPLEEDDFKITCLKNKRAVKKHELLTVFKVAPPTVEKPTKTEIVEPPPKRKRGAAGASDGSGKGGKGGSDRARKLLASVKRQDAKGQGKGKLLARVKAEDAKGQGKGKGSGRK